MTHGNRCACGQYFTGPDPLRTGCAACEPRPTLDALALVQCRLLYGPGADRARLERLEAYLIGRACR